MTTYNGSKFLEDLLSSIKNQSFNIDEVLIFDDASTDDTFNTLRRFICINGENNCKIVKKI